MWPNPQFSADLITYTEQILNGKLHFLYSETSIGSLTNSFYDTALATILAFRLPPEVILSLKYGQKTLEWIILYIQLGH